MPTNDSLPLTVRGKAKLEDELKRLMYTERPSVIKAIEEARAHGDISENAEYEAAKERQSMVEGRIIEIQGQIAGAEVIDVSLIKSDKVVFGAHVVLLDSETDEEVEYQIVGVDEADVKQGRISILSPIARAMIGKTKGDTVQVRSPKADKEYEIKEFFTSEIVELIGRFCYRFELKQLFDFWVRHHLNSLAVHAIIGD